MSEEKEKLMDDMEWLFRREIAIILETGSLDDAPACTDGVEGMAGLERWRK